MAASRAAHPLAEAIVELAVPPVKEAYITLRAASSGGITRALLLHVRPGPGPGLQVALHSGVRTRDQEGSNTFGFRVAGGAFDVPTSAAGIGGFVADLLAGSDFIVNLLESKSIEWREVSLDLHPVDAVTISAPPPGPVGAAARPDHVLVRLPVDSFFGILIHKGDALQRPEAVRRLADGLAAMLRQACRFRGTSALAPTPARPAGGGDGA